MSLPVPGHYSLGLRIPGMTGKGAHPHLQIDLAFPQRDQDSGSSPERRRWMAWAALRPAPMARITVAEPVTMSPPA